MALLRVLGAGSALPRAGYGSAGYALILDPDEAPAADGGGRRVTLLDCGPGSVRAMGEGGIALNDVRRVVLSHYHLDHCLDLFALAFARRNPSVAPAPPLSLLGPVGLERLVTRAPDALGKHARDPDASIDEIELDRDGRGGFEADGMRFRCVKNGHCAESVSWRIDLPGRWSLAYTGDTNDDPAVAELARGVDVLVAECSFLEEDATPNHLTPRSAAGLARDAAARRLILSHFYPTNDPATSRARAAEVFAGPIECARDGSVHRLPG